MPTEPLPGVAMEGDKGTHRRCGRQRALRDEVEMTDDGAADRTGAPAEAEARSPRPRGDRRISRGRARRRGRVSHTAGVHRLSVRDLRRSRAHLAWLRTTWTFLALAIGIGVLEPLGAHEFARPPLLSGGYIAIGLGLTVAVSGVLVWLAPPGRASSRCGGPPG